MSTMGGLPIPWHKNNKVEIADPQEHPLHPSSDKYKDDMERDKMDGTSLEEEFGAYKYNKFTDPNAWGPALRPYIIFSNFNQKICENSHFNNFIIFCIILAGALVGVQTYEGMDNDPVVLALDFIILVFFAAECVFKIFAEGIAIWRFWLGAEWKWNNFDFFIVLACVPGLLNLGKQVVVLRLLRLMRLAKVFRKIPQLQMIVMGLVGGMKSISYIVLLLFMVFYLYAILGIMMFQDNDPFHWGSIDLAMMSLFRASTLEDWTDIMYFNIYGCDEYKVGGGITYCDLGTDDCAFLIPDYVDSAGENVYLMDCSFENCTGHDVNDLGETIRHVYNSGNLTIYNSQVLCQAPSPSTVGAPIFFISFIVVSALVMLSLFVGAVTMAMADSMEEMKKDQDEKDKIARLEKGKKAAEDLKTASVRSNRNFKDAAEFTEDDEEEMEEVLTGKMARERARMKALLMAAWDGSEVDPNMTAEVPFEGWKKQYAQWAAKMEKLTEANWFQNFVTFVIMIAGAQVGFQTYEAEDIKHADTIAVVDLIISTIFTVEVVFKLIACEFEPWLFFNSGWNRFDFALVMGGYLPLDFDLKMLRLLRLLRVLKLVNKLPQLQVIITALMMGVVSIGYIGVILCIFFYFFAIVGMIFFGQNDPWHFGSLHVTMLTLFRASTLEDWTDIMYINTYGCEIYGYSAAMNDALGGAGCGSPEAMSRGQADISVTWKGSPMSSTFFLIFIMIGALVLLTLFVGVVTTSMEEATEDMKEKMELEEEVQKVAEEENIPAGQVEMYRTVFGILDLDGGGSIEEDELKIGLDAIGRYPGDEALQKMLLEVDESGDGEVDFAEFLQFMMVEGEEGEEGWGVGEEDGGGDGGGE
ncbi:hypothetical protein TrLO_g11007 [Triparma laevis f. longispina]|uniref:EF-hand domain-containing protein n=1 Tax=Triparma laevis f. longispina TaxID=1714387 RepID=A0A9W7C7V3_9STRA|nr:hypothetical protein TrLO_g11007 [Triparma laevis f. longispina]